MTELGPGKEFDLICRMRDRWGPLAVGIGDDVAVLHPPAEQRLVVSVDAAIEDVHFRRDWLSLREAGYRAVTAALSDLAAAAATPRGVLIALSLPNEDHEVLDELTDGIGDAVRAADTVVIGGNLARSAPLTITTTVIGSAAAPLARHGARPGDLVYVTGRLGGPRAAIRALQSGAGASLPADLRARLARPSARLAESRWLAARDATAAIDISDGLASDAGHLAAASHVALDIDVDSVPVFPGATSQDALAGGEEFELLVTARQPIAESEFAARFGIPLTRIGRVSKGEGSVELASGGKRVAAPKGYDHFSP